MEPSKQNIHWTLILKGMAMGVAEIIPGVSGGTIAFITGIYERLMRAIKSIGPDAWTAYRQRGVKGFWAAIDGTFLVVLILGMVGGLVTGAFGVTWLLENHPLQLWGFFFGLILASFVYVLLSVGRLNWGHWIFVALGTAFAFYITLISPAEGNSSLVFVGLCGMIAISAMLLPGISGSFMLLLMGMYTYILTSFKDVLTTFEMDKILVILVFGLGCLVGVAFFSRVITWTFTHFRKPTLALLSGFILGSLNKVWPWREAAMWMDEDGKKYTKNDVLPDKDALKLLTEENVWPGAFEGDPQVVSVCIVMLIAVGLVWGLSKFSE